MASQKKAAIGWKTQVKDGANREWWTKAEAAWMIEGDSSIGASLGQVHCSGELKPKMASPRIRRGGKRQ